MFPPPKRKKQQESRNQKKTSRRGNPQKKQKKPEGPREHENDLSDMGMMNMQALQLMECIRVAYHLCEVDEPMAKAIQDAKSSDHANEQKNALDSEYNSLIENKTWKFVELPPGPRKAIGCK